MNNYLIVFEDRGNCDIITKEIRVPSLQHLFELLELMAKNNEIHLDTTKIVIEQIG